MIKMHQLISAYEYDGSGSLDFIAIKMGFSSKTLRNKFYEVSSLFGHDLDVIVLITDQASIWKDIASSYQIPDWACAFSFDNSVIIKHRRLWDESNVGTFEETVIHEIVHCFITACCESKLPIWLNEALAVHLSDQSKYYRKVELEGIDYTELNYSHPMLYDLSVSKLNDLLRCESIQSLLYRYLRGGAMK